MVLLFYFLKYSALTIRIFHILGKSDFSSSSLNCFISTKGTVQFCLNTEVAPSFIWKLVFVLEHSRNLSDRMSGKFFCLSFQFLWRLLAFILGKNNNKTILQNIFMEKSRKSNNSIQSNKLFGLFNRKKNFYFKGFNTKVKVIISPTKGNFFPSHLITIL